MNINFKQSGVSLISLMVGMAISLMTLAAAGVLFQQTYKISNTLANDAISEGALSTVMAELQMATLSAGFGMSNTTDKHFVFIETGDESTAYWRYDLSPNVANTVECKGFKEFVNDDEQLEFQWLTASCTSSEDLLAKDEGDWVKEGVSTILQKQSTSKLKFISYLTEVCWPYADGVRSDHVLFKIETEDGIKYEFNFCLVNT
ncbi:MAG: hypothetical protein HRU38_25560 [Saccharospirillaceae bacterium]|nr:hypothetical protein [Pseudomonadales bacterium]NRB81982.1 hypothetical protein [Saccharospirillaceae bacterium]